MRILVVDDEPEICTLLRLALTQHSFSVDLAEDGEKASYLGRTNDYDVIILDNILPKKMGLQVCREIRAAGKTVPILVLSAMPESATKVALLDAGADDYLSKPFSMDELLARVRALSRRPKQIAAEILTFDDLILNTKALTVYRAKREVHLTPKEFMLLEYLLRNKGAALPRSLILVLCCINGFTTIDLFHDGLN
jgi:DNA-binding response OmpR family regulator